MADITGIGNLQGFGHRWRDKAEGVTSNIYVSDRLLNFRHVAGNALVAGAVCLMVAVRLQRRLAGSVG